MRMTVIALALLSLLACSGHEQNARIGVLGSSRSSYVGQWAEINGSDRIKIDSEGGAFIVVDESGKKYAATIENGLLKVYINNATLVGLYMPSNDHLLLAKEFRRLDASEAKGSDYRSAAKRTLSDIRTIATSLEARATDQNSYADKPGTPDADAVAAMLEPTYIRRLPRRDAWGNAFRFVLAPEGYTIRSLGADGRENDVVAGTTVDPDCDIVYADGNFVTYPDIQPREE